MAFISIATVCHQAWSANLFTVASDAFPSRAVGSVVGLGGMCDSSLVAMQDRSVLARPANVRPRFFHALSGTWGRRPRRLSGGGKQRLDRGCHGSCGAFVAGGGGMIAVEAHRIAVPFVHAGAERGA